ncbi:MAG TPA: biotin carboxylase N-terminal domain-containing protein [Mycobacteriales bacterium]|nr:biotin carboxylase N-terminal domain-containing protein [Mycobacteriales bacterium]
MFDSVLIANRGEIAVRITRTLRRLGIRSIAVYTDADATARHMAEADVAVRLDGDGGYLDIGAILDAAARTGAAAVHPGYGFLAENARFAQACERAGLVFVGPPAAAIEAMGDKIRAKQIVAKAGVPVVPGSQEPGMSDQDIAEAAVETGFPVLLKPSAGGGGKGMRLVASADGLAEQIAAARREARAAFGDDTLLVERYVTSPRHIEVQVFADRHGTVLYLGERECSLQRRHQKIVEEAPSPLLDEPTRARMGAAAVEAARSVGYVGAGTVEFIVPGGPEADAEFFFMEMNTRLQVEHPVTELVTGLDLVELQLRVAAGEPLPFGQPEVRVTGHAVEARVYAEDPARGFLPTGGRVLALSEPDGAHLRVDSALAAGVEVGSRYDPMLAKVVAWGADRAEALHRLDGALGRTVLLGVTTNIAFLRALLADPDVAAGRLDTGLVERRVAELAGGAVPDDVLAAAGLARLLATRPAGPVVDPFDSGGGWRLGEPAWTRFRLHAGPAGTPAVEVRVRGLPSHAEVVLVTAGTADTADTAEAAEAAEAAGTAGAAGPAGPVAASARLDGEWLTVTYGGITRRYACAVDGRAAGGTVTWLARDGRTFALTEEPPTRAAGRDRDTPAGPVRAPMPGTVTLVRVADGDRVAAGQPLLVVEAMKMEHVVTAPRDGVVTELSVHRGTQVGLDEPLATVRPDAPATDGEGQP